MLFGIKEMPKEVCVATSPRVKEFSLSLGISMLFFEGGKQDVAGSLRVLPPANFVLSTC